MKIPGTEAHLHLPSWPEGFDIMECLYQGVNIKFDKKTGDIFIRVERPEQPLEDTPELDEGQEHHDGA